VRTLTLIGKAGCHLCDEARATVMKVLEEFDDVILVEKSIDDDTSLRAEYWEQIPVVLIDGRVHNFWHIDSARLITKLKEEQ
jgi:glutaredoxin